MNIKPIMYCDLIADCLLCLFLIYIHMHQLFGCVTFLTLIWKFNEFEPTKRYNNDNVQHAFSHEFWGKRIPSSKFHIVTTVWKLKYQIYPNQRNIPNGRSLTIWQNQKLKTLNEWKPNSISKWLKYNRIHVKVNFLFYAK